MTTTDITLPVVTTEAALTAMREVVAEFGADYLYPRQARGHNNRVCSYERGGKPSCLIAQVLFRLGYTIEQLNEMDESGGPIRHQIRVNRVRTDSYMTGVVLGAAQSYQDNERTWGAALRHAERRAAELGIVA